MAAGVPARSVLSAALSLACLPACAQIFPQPDLSTKLAIAYLVDKTVFDRLLAETANAELIARLPPAGQEHAFSNQSGEWTENPFSLEWANRIEKGKVSTEELGAAIRKTGMLRSSPACFKGEAYHVTLRMPSWLPFRQASAKPHLLSAESAFAYVRAEGLRCGNEVMWQETEETFQTIGPLADSTTEVAFTLELSSPKYRGLTPPEWSGEITLPVQMIAKQLPQPIDSRELTALIREQAASISLFTGTSQGDNWVVLFGRMHRPLDGPLASTLMGLKAEIMKDEEVVAAYSVPDPDEGGEQSGLIMPTFVRGKAPELPKDLVLHLGKNAEVFTLRVSGEAPLKPSRWGRTSYWSGRYTVPLSDVLKTRGK